ncbi:tigger transposable element-derived protein 1-like [Dendropsophus ebraccatus]|uniref:tigger transposable element-derived protein 1-like n=1 Tax=Dendropsophus ebraccatus TaxID=150705 RepID=UPI0038312DEF
MAPKPKPDSADASASKKRKAITMEVKLDIIKRYDKGETGTDIGRSLGLSRSTVATIIKDKDRILEHVKGSAPMKATVITKQRSGLIIEMERLLVLWLEDQNQRRIPVSLMVIQEKARRLFEVLKRVQGEAASGDDKAAREFPKALAQIIAEGDYCAQQLFNVDESGLFWKRLPNRTYISKEEKSAPGHKVSKERLTLLLGGNAVGEYKLKPMLVYQAENPRALKGISKAQLPVIWKSNRKAWVTLAVFKDWFNNYFVPSVERYCTSKDIPFKVLLILDNAPGHPADVDDFHPNNIADSWDEVKETSMNCVWKKLCPQFVTDVTEVQESVTSVIQNVVAMSKTMNLEVEEEDVTELLASHGEELSAEDLIQLEKQIIEEEEDIPTPEPKRFTRQGLARGFALIEEGLSKFEAEDPNMERYSSVARGVMDSLRCYKEILEEKKMVSFQTNLQQYFKTAERPATDPVPVPVPSTSAAPLDLPAPVSPAPSAASSQ